MFPMLATTGDHVPGEGWVHEVKWDGMRVLVDRDATGLRVWSRNENDVTVSFPELGGLAATGRDFLLDGEVVALGEGVPSFGALADRMHVRDANRAARLATTNPVTLIAFDLLRLDGEDLRARPLRERRALLEGLGLDDVAWQVPPTYDDGAMLLAAAEQQGLEGIVSKRLASPYRAGQRSRDWLKFPIRPTGSFVVGGFRHETGSDHRIGAVLVGQPSGPRAAVRRQGRQRHRRQGRPAAHRAARAAAHRRLTLRRRAAASGPARARCGCIRSWWSTCSTSRSPVTGRLRQPAYRGIRTDLVPDDLLEPPADEEG